MNVKLKLALLEHPEPQYVVAQRMGGSETWLSRVVQERILPTAEEQARLASILRVEADELFGKASESDTSTRSEGP